MKNSFTKARLTMVSSDLIARGIMDHKVLEVMGHLKREEFVPEDYKPSAYADGPLPIGCGQTISQPYIVALMTEALNVTEKCSVLEIGTGCGYQTAILAKLAKKVYTIERFNQLSEAAQAVLSRGKVKNVEFFIGDGSGGWQGKKTFDRIIVTAALPSIPGSLVQQLKENGIIVVPIGSGWIQKLVVGEKKEKGLIEKTICDVRFVRVVGRYGFKE